MTKNSEVLNFSFEISDLNKDQEVVKFHVLAWHVYIQCEICSARIAVFHFLFFYGSVEECHSPSSITGLLLQ